MKNRFRRFSGFRGYVFLNLLNFLPPHNQPIPFPVYVQDFDSGVFPKILAQLAHIYVEAAATHQIVVAPDAAEGRGAVNQAIFALAKKLQQPGFNRRHFQ